VKFYKDTSGIVELIMDDMEARETRIDPRQARQFIEQEVAYFLSQQLSNGITKIEDVIECGPAANSEAAEMLERLEVLLGGRERMMDRWVSEIG